MTDCVDPHLWVVLGGTGDLHERKLLPALHALCDSLPTGSRILGVARRGEHDDKSYERWSVDALVAAGVPESEAAEWCRGRIHFHTLGSATPEDYASLAGRIRSIEKEAGLTGNRVFYLALPPGAFPSTITGLGNAGLGESEGWTRLVIEKPFGRDLESAQALNELVHEHFDEDQIYRIDHYLGKETVQNLLAFRFANAIFEPLWNRDHVASVQITVAESLGIEGRGAYYEKSGALRDMLQNHLTQLLSLVAMEAPIDHESDEIRHEKVKALRAVKPIDPDRIVFGQYHAGEIDGRAMPGYLEEEGVPDSSKVETFVAGELRISNWRWQGVPFFFRTGKALARKLTQIAIVFRRPPIQVFERFGACQVHSNALMITLQPDEGFSLYFHVKRPGSDAFLLETLPLQFRYSDRFGSLPDGYQTLCLDVLTGDQTLFVRADEVETSWKLYTPILERSLPIHPYEPGSWGPKAASELLLPDHTWRLP